jgi:hypothetical protein
MRRSAVYAAVFAVALAASGRCEIKIDGERAVKENSFAELTVKDTSTVVWRVYPTPVKKVSKGGSLYFSGKPGMEYVVSALVIDFAAQSFEEGETVVTFAGAAPVPVPPIEAAPKSMGLSLGFGPWSNGTATGSIATITGTAKITGGDPPGPKPPDPKPPDPPPTPPNPDAPIPADGFRVLLVYESAELANLPREQYSIIFAKQVRDYLNLKCVVGEDGKTKEWRMWDKDVQAGAESKLWQDALKRPRTKTPWLIVSTGKTGYEGPLPATVSDMMKLLKQFGGGGE